MISVIVPVYNTEKYLHKCVDSILGQTYSNLEVILVDDGSTDCSGAICDDYGNKDFRVKVIHKANGGQCSARNLALDSATGNYIGFVDSDDWIEPNMYELLLENLLLCGADISCCNYSAFVNGSEKDKREIFHQPQIMAEHLSENYGTDQSPCNKLFRKRLFDGVRFPEMRAYEDCATIFRLLGKANTVVRQDANLYHYETRDNSTMTQPFSAVKYLAIDAYYQMYTYYQKHFPQYAALVKEKLVGSIQYCVGETLKRGKGMEYKNEMERAGSVLREIGYADLPVKNRLLVFLMMNLPWVYGLIYSITKKAESTR